MHPDQYLPISHGVTPAAAGEKIHYIPIGGHTGWGGAQTGPQVYHLRAGLAAEESSLTEPEKGVTAFKNCLKYYRLFILDYISSLKCSKGNWVIIFLV